MPNRFEPTQKLIGNLSGADLSDPHNNESAISDAIGIKAQWALKRRNRNGWAGNARYEKGCWTASDLGLVFPSD